MAVFFYFILYYYKDCIKLKNVMLQGSCSVCGSNFYFESSRWPGEKHITVANLLSPLDRAPKIHVFLNDDRNAGWLDLVAALPRYGGATGLEEFKSH
jgi:hypothetical protein